MEIVDLPGVGKCPNWTLANYWGYFISNKYIWFGDVQNPQKGTFTDLCLPIQKGDFQSFRVPFDGPPGA